VIATIVRILCRDEIRAVLAVNIVAKVKGDCSALWEVADGAELCIEKNLAEKKTPRETRG
jgi:hypothetical protein